MRQNKLAILGFFICSAGMFIQPNAFAKKIDEASYQYPYKDPYLATTTVALMNGSEKLSTAEIKDLRIEILKNRNNIRLLEGKGLLRYRFYQQKGPAPLIFIIPGLAGSAYTGTVRFLAEWLADHGFHVLILPSPLNWNFTLAASTTGAPGHSQDDTRDLYAAMRKVLDDVKINQGAEIGKVGVLGLSDGALYSVYLSKMDEEKRQIGIQTYLLVNPPVDLFEAVRKIDKMADIGKDYPAKKKKSIEDYALGVMSESMARDSHDPAYFQDWDKRFKLRDREIEYLIGKSMRDDVGDAIYAIDLSNNESVLKTPVSQGYRSKHLEEARSFSLMEYVERVVIPRLRHNDGKTMNLKQLEALNSIRSIASTLANKRSVFLMHNLDDILVSRDDVLYLEKALGDRATLYPHGGHLGNLWYPDNKEHIVEIFRPLLQGAEP
ncbi:MAG: alpha/beta hydrolase [Methylomonas sp.]